MKSFSKEGSENIMIRATKEEWQNILQDLEDAGYRFSLFAESGDLITQLKSFGIEV